MHGPKIIHDENGKIFIERFSLIRRIEHILIILAFLILAITGMPQKFYETAWLGDLMDLIGGLDRARTIHHLTGILFSIQLMLHLLYIVIGIALKKISLSLLPRMQDWRDLSSSIKYYFGYKKTPPQYDTFDYKQKFEYVSILSAAIIMSISGIVLLAPVFATTFFSGQIVPAARIAHSNEALLAILLILIWHIYGAHFAPETFPMDKTIFTGLINKDDLKAKHPLEYNRLFPEDKKN
ncbi:MAG: hypothetical protein A2504_07375 [Bdellovibrionales bacterium RIFOXYD12_FULL_39_22]|nr:MAG: hypothetical protein A2385_16745 [Bdellovibrionales bacterium RIFOXYB1_FULL_39_21]OFZ44698.1 MAG: hypothetical protein A2485_14605 [Bdellovibrionales bacterium RIFOXYC12_FULL_39_17]OFZ49328.1 MAG: hypothetical protein A2404_08900 [Bdellovibrionales bacterium RIFOXYC1_FULL_39_130]OFZ69694.1 MAG: hypothetical protein A2451_04105 [Bdellovibrionales bacterium RIFOXYC2_FULL_39_8]OFZ77064.1 MAG: hypothetical protein A2560_09865 [Bdellovibrionales bacterium RIFOXYD1_FULL_39_84]OFZ95324.1 MAG: